MSGDRQADLVALVGSRICHDLVSPLGAIGNGLELLQMMGVGNSPEMALVTDSVETAAARVKLFRLAFGAATRGHTVSGDEVRAHVAGIGKGRIAVDWATPGDLDRATAKLALLLLFCAETLMPYGGEVRIAATPARVDLAVTADRLREAGGLLAQLGDAEAPMPTASEVHFPLARLAAADLGRRIAVTRGDGALAIAA